MEGSNANLGEIKAYCAAMGIEIKPTLEEPTVVSNIQGFGDVDAQAYFTFYFQNKDVVDSWVRNYRSMQEQYTETTSRTR